MALQDQSIGAQNFVKKYDSKIVCSLIFALSKRALVGLPGEKQGSKRFKSPQTP